VQTFLPFPDFEASARVLDRRRLGKQRVETLQVARGLIEPDYGWRNHPAVLMWRGHEEALGRYGQTVCRVWCELGHADSCEAKLLADLGRPGLAAPRSQAELAAAGALPPWLGDLELHRSHQSVLLRKDPGWYRRFFPGVPDDLPYVWPVRSPQAVAQERRRQAAAEAGRERDARRGRVRAEQLAVARSRAARKGWRTRRANRRPDDEGAAT
jgi:hypothetical protein